MTHTLRAAHISGIALLLTLALMRSADAQVIVTPTVNFSDGLYHYNYSISNSTANDVFIVDITVPINLPSVVQNLSAPAGFQSQFDSTLGLVSFLEDTSVFSATPVNGFIFDSPLAPGPAPFNTTFVTPGGQTGTGSGRTSAPATPEPGSLAVIGALGASGLLALRRRKTSSK